MQKLTHGMQDLTPAGKAQTGTWQEAPIDAAPGYLASKPTTEQLPSAVRNGHRARQNILSDAPALTSEPFLPLDGTSGLAVPDYRHVCTLPSSVVFHLRHMDGCSLRSNSLLQCPKQLPRCPDSLLRHPPGDNLQCTGRVPAAGQLPVRYSVSRLAVVSRTASSCIAQWRQVRLRVEDSVGLGVWDGRDNLARCHAAFVVHAADGSVLHALGADVPQAFEQQRLGPVYLYMLWSPDGKYLLVCWRAVRAGVLQHAVNCSGRLMIISIADDKVLASSWLPAGRCTTTGAPAAVTWLPSSDGIVVSWDCIFQEMASFMTAGFAVGMLPSPAAHEVGFSADGCFLNANEGFSPEDFAGTFALFSPSRQGLEIHLALVCKISADKVSWVPGHSSLCIVYGEGRVEVVNVHARYGVSPMRRQMVPLPHDTLFSPSGQFGIELYGRASMINMYAYQPVHSNPQMQEPSVGVVNALQLMSTLEGAWVHCRICFPTNHKVIAWLPSGLGLISLSLGSGDKELLSLCCIYFA